MAASKKPASRSVTKGSPQPVAAAPAKPIVAAPVVVVAPAKKPAATKPAKAATPAAKPTHDQIAAKAHEIWIAKGRPDGLCAQNWAEAEQLLGK
jgi:hypothetical protein